MHGLAQVPDGGQVFGFRADSVVRVGLAVLATALSASAILAFGLGARREGAMLALTGGILGVGMAAGQALEYEHERADRARQASLGGFR